MDINRLVSDELSYELKIRGIELGGTVSEKRGLLRASLSKERSSESASFVNVQLDAHQELNVCAIKLDELTGHIQEFDNANAENNFRRIQSRLLHVEKRLLRIVPDTKEKELKRKNLLELCAGLSEALRDAYRISGLCQGPSVPAEHSIMDEPIYFHRNEISTEKQTIPENNLMEIDDVPSQANEQNVQMNPPSPRERDLANLSRKLENLSLQCAAEGISAERHVSFVDPCAPKTDTNRNVENREHCSLYPEQMNSTFKNEYGDPSNYSPYGNFRRYIPLCKWNTFFDGSTNVATFLEEVDELAESRRVSRIELFQTASEILRGDALLWYRYRKHMFRDWEDLKMQLRSAFLPFDYEATLLDEIRRRTQGPDEKLLMFVTRMENLFNKLSKKPSESEQVNIIRRNLRPNIHTALALQKIETLDEILRLGRAVEESFWRAKQYHPPNFSLSCSEESKMLGQRTNASKHLTIHAARVEHLTSDAWPPANAENTQKNHSTERKQITCWNCRKLGHRRSGCPEPLKLVCFGCGREGVTVRQCLQCQGNSRQGH